MSPIRSRYKELGLELLEPLKDHHCRLQWPPMVEEKRDNGLVDPINLLLEEALARHRDKMMNNFSKIPRPLSTTTYTSSLSGHFGGATPFKVRVNFDIPLFKFHIDANDLEKWLNMPKGYFYVHNFSNKENITFGFLKVVSHVKNWRGLIVRTNP
jgi:hypothetical protein